jgi:hypothetical protein
MVLENRAADPNYSELNVEYFKRSRFNIRHSLLARCSLDSFEVFYVRVPKSELDLIQHKTSETWIEQRKQISVRLSWV